MFPHLPTPSQARRKAFGNNNDTACWNKLSNNFLCIQSIPQGSWSSELEHLSSLWAATTRIKCPPYVEDAQPPLRGYHEMTLSPYWNTDYSPPLGEAPQKGIMEPENIFPVCATAPSMLPDLRHSRQGCKGDINPCCIDSPASTEPHANNMNATWLISILTFMWLDRHF